MTFAADFSQVNAEIAILLSRLADPVPFFDFVGDHEKHAIRERIMSTKQDPDGKDWIPWAPYTAEKRDLSGTLARGIMWETGTLLDSVQSEVDGAFGVDIGTDVWYAEQHQEGRGKIPRRQIFGWETNMLPVYAQAFATFLETGKI